MRYAIRDPQGAIVSLHREPLPGAEALPVQHPEVQAFLGNEGERSFAQLDANLVRVLEDLIDALIANGTLRMTDLPIQAQQKLTQRKQQRARLSEHLDLLDDEDGQVI